MSILDRLSTIYDMIKKDKVLVNMAKDKRKTMDRMPHIEDEMMLFFDWLSTGINYHKCLIITQ